MRISECNFAILTVFLAVHAITAFYVIDTPFTITGGIWLIGLVAFRWAGFTCAAHRYFAHRVCNTSRVFQFVLGVWATLTMARSPIRFASGHRHHHLYSDRRGDLHSFKQDGFWKSYIGWAVSKRYHEMNLGRVGDLIRFKELVWLNKFYFVPNAILLFGLGVGVGREALVFGGLLSILVTWHLAFSVSVLFHLVGRPSYDTSDDSKNSFWLALFTMGEGWHNNHHANPRSARLGHKWWQFDVGYLVFLCLEKIGLVWNLNRSVGPAHQGIAQLPVRHLLDVEEGPVPSLQSAQVAYRLG